MTRRVSGRVSTGRATLLAAALLLAAPPGFANCPAMGPAPSGGGIGGGDAGNSNSSSSGGNTSANSNGGGWSGSNSGGEAARQGASGAAAGDLDSGGGGSRRSGGGGDQQSGNYTSQIDSLANSDAQNGQGGGSQAKTSCAALERETNDAQQMLFMFDVQHGGESGALQSKQQALQNLQTNGAPHFTQAEIDKQLVMWTSALQYDDQALKTQARALISYFGQLKLTGTSDTGGLVAYYQQAVDAAQAQVQQTAQQRQPLAENLQFLQGQLKECQSQ